MFRIFRLFELMLPFVFVVMQNGVTSSIKPQQITYIIPGVENFDQAEILKFLQKAQENLVRSPCFMAISRKCCGFLLWLTSCKYFGAGPNIT